jgi:hypothetical protein
MTTSKMNKAHEESAQASIDHQESIGLNNFRRAEVKIEKPIPPKIAAAIHTAIKNNEVDELFRIVRGKKKEVSEAAFKQMIVQSGNQLILAAYAARSGDMDVGKNLERLIELGALTPKAREYLLKAAEIKPSANKNGETFSTLPSSLSVQIAKVELEVPLRRIGVVHSDTSIRRTFIETEIRRTQVDQLDKISADLLIVALDKRGTEKDKLIIASRVASESVMLHILEKGDESQIQALRFNPYITETVRARLPRLGGIGTVKKIVTWRRR